MLPAIINCEDASHTWTFVRSSYLTLAEPRVSPAGARVDQSGSITCRCCTWQSFWCGLSAAFNAFISSFATQILYVFRRHSCSAQLGVLQLASWLQAHREQPGIRLCGSIVPSLSRHRTVPPLSSTNGHGSVRASLRQTDTRKRGLAV